ncbi:DUF6492 family protein [Rhodoblastus sp.]|uniref:DUF6492 family protein n=1 Tax=Rhodoblastus sp. TaxID=1962975 RepID=UPI0035B3C979
MSRQSLDASILTLSYSGDLPYCRLLCESLDRFASPGMAHRLFVPTRDKALFAPLANAHRIIGSQDRDLLPFWLQKIPMPGPRLRDLLHLPRRNIYFNLYGPPVRGWIAQQIMKISAAADSPTEIVLHVDSDGVFIRPLPPEFLQRADGAVRFYRNPQAESRDTHVLWRAVACRLLGLDPAAIVAGDYIGLCVVWRRSIVRRMIQRIEQVGGDDWRRILAREPHFSEYTLYGLFVESLGVAAAGHFIDPSSPIHGIWDIEPETPEEEQAFVRALEPHHLTCLIQSTALMSFEKRLELLDRVAAQAALQDSASASGPPLVA